jgi:uncharacterized membrane protein
LNDIEKVMTENHKHMYRWFACFVVVAVITIVATVIAAYLVSRQLSRPTTTIRHIIIHARQSR